MPGVFISYFNFDDGDNSCSCGNYPVLQCIKAGVLNNPEPSIINCKTFGVLKRDLDKVIATTTNS